MKIILSAFKSKLTLFVPDYPMFCLHEPSNLMHVYITYSLNI
jgi:hypothetical protein